MSYLVIRASHACLPQRSALASPVVFGVFILIFAGNDKQQSQLRLKLMQAAESPMQ